MNRRRVMVVICTGVLLPPVLLVTGGFGFFYLNWWMYQRDAEDWLVATLKDDHAKVSQTAVHWSYCKEICTEVYGAQEAAKVVEPHIPDYAALLKALANDPYELEFTHETYFGLHYLLRFRNGVEYECVVGERNHFIRPWWKVELYLLLIGKPTIPDKAMYMAEVGDEPIRRRKDE